MRDVDGGEAQLLLQAADLHAHLDAQLRVEVGERLVEHQQIRLDDQRARKRHALPLSAGHLARIAALKALQVDDLQHVQDFFSDGLLVHLAHLQAEGHVVKHGQVREERIALEHEAEVALVQRHLRVVLTVKDDLARHRLGEAGDHAQAGGLAAAGGAQQGDKLALFHAQVKILEDDVLIVSGGDVFQFEQCHLFVLLTPSG